MNKDNIDIVKEIVTRDIDFLTPARKSGLICPICGSGSGKAGTGIYRETKKHTDKYYYICADCKTGGDTFDWWCYYHNYKKGKEKLENELYQKALKECAEHYNIETTGISKLFEPAKYEPIPPKETVPTVPPIEPEPEQQKEIQELIAKNKFNDLDLELLPENDKEKYLKYVASRNITPETLYKAGVLASVYKCGNFKVLCLAKENNTAGSYEIRIIENVDQPKRTIGTKDITNFNCGLNNGIIFITEGLFDSLSLYQIGFNSICLNSTNSQNILHNYLEQNKKFFKYKTFILALDNDKKGIETANYIKENFQDLHLDIRINNLVVENNYNDINDFHVAEPDKFKDVFYKYVIKVKNELINNNQDTFLYWWNNKKEQEQATRDVKISTGINGIDKIAGGGLPIGLTILGALSSLGKTTLLSQIAENIASQEIDVLFFSLEQSPFEIFSKGLLRNLYKNNMYYTDKFNIDNVKNYYSKITNYYNVIQGDFTFTTYNIQEKIKQVRQYRKNKMVVIVDYLQALKPCDMENGDVLNKLSDKQATDKLIQDLKLISNIYEIPIIAISSLNRESYYSKIELNSFKETGNIEYTADLIFGMDLSSIRSNIKGGEKTQAKDNKIAIDNEYNKDIRLITITTLKNRNGKAREKTELAFNTKYGIFTVPEATETNILVSFGDPEPEPDTAEQEPQEQPQE